MYSNELLKKGKFNTNSFIRNFSMDTIDSQHIQRGDTPDVHKVMHRFCEVPTTIFLDGEHS